MVSSGHFQPFSRAPRSKQQRKTSGPAGGERVAPQQVTSGRERKEKHVETDLLLDLQVGTHS